VVEAIGAIVAFAADHADRLVELEVNPLLVLPGRAVAVDALIRLAEPDPVRPVATPHGDVTSRRSR
jgi:hypothetical protein